MALISTLTDGFATKDTTKWTWGQSAGVTTNGTETVANLPAAGYGSGANGSIITTASYDLTNSSVYFDVYQRAVANATSGEVAGDFGVSVSGTINSGARVFFRAYRSTSSTSNGYDLLYTLDGTTTVMVNNGGAIADARYLRIRADATNIYYDTSSDETTWTTRGTLPRSTFTPAITAMYVFAYSNGSGTAYQISDINGGGTAGTPPTAPQSVTATNVTNTTAQINWAAPSSAGSSAITAYRVAWGGWESADLAPTTFSTATDFPGGLTGFSAGTTYTVSVYAFNATGGRSPAGTVTFTTTGTAPVGGTSTGIPSVALGIYYYNTSLRYTDAALSRFNFFMHAFSTGNSAGTMSAPSGTYTGMKADIDSLNAAGRKVILSLGGAADGTVINSAATANNMFNSLVTIIDTYGFKGVDFDFEASSTYTAEALRTVAAKLKTKYGSGFIVTCAPGGGNAVYTSFAATQTTGWTSSLDATVSYTGVLCDAIMPQIYDYTANDTQRATDAVNEVNRLISAGVPASRILIGCGLPWSSYLWYSSPANMTGGNAPSAYLSAWTQLKNAGKQIRGMFLWNVGWDNNTAGASRPAASGYAAVSGQWQFRDTMYAGISPTTTPVVTVTAPGAPTNLAATRSSTDATRATVTWSAPSNDGGGAIDGYRLTWVSGSTTTVVSTSATSPATLTGLPTAAVTVTVEAHNSVGYGPTSSVTMPAVATLPLIGSLADDFNGTQSSIRVFDAGVVQRNGEIEYDVLDNVHRGTYVRGDMRNQAAFYQMMPNTATNVVTVFFVRSSAAPSTQSIRIAYVNGVVISRFDNGTADASPGSSVYNATSMRYWRISNVGTATVQLATSPDGSTWTPLARSGFAAPEWLGDVQVGVEVYQSTTV